MSNKRPHIIQCLLNAFYTNFWDLNKRACRREFWSVMILQLLVASIFLTLHFLYFESMNEGLAPIMFYSISYFYLILTTTPTFTVHIRRLHDVGKSGIWHPLGLGFVTNVIVSIIALITVFFYALIVLLAFEGNPPIDSKTIEITINIVSIIISLVLLAFVLTGIIFLFYDSQEGSNKWGENPKEIG